MKKLYPDLLAILAFVLISFAYFFPADVEDRMLFQHDTEAGVGAGQEAATYLKETGERTRWTNSIFGGMPTYQLTPSYDSTQPLSWAQKVYRLFLPEYVYLTFILMLGFYILLRVFNLPAWYAALGGNCLGFFFVLLYPDFGRTPVEVHYAGVCAAYDSGHGADVSGEITGRGLADHFLRGFAD